MRKRERGIVYMFEKGQLTWVKKDRWIMNVGEEKDMKNVPEKNISICQEEFSHAIL